VKPGPDPILADESKRKELLGVVALGMSLKKACLYVGILDLKTLRHYRDNNPEFDQEITRAELKGEIWHLNNWRMGAAGQPSEQGHEVDWRASMEFLARKYPDDWARRDKHQIDVSHRELHGAMDKVLSDPDALAAAEALAVHLSKADENADESGD